MVGWMGCKYVLNMWFISVHYILPGNQNNRKQLVVPILQLRSFTHRKWMFAETSISFWLFGVTGVYIYIYRVDALEAEGSG